MNEQDRRLIEVIRRSSSKAQLPDMHASRLLPDEHQEHTRKYQEERLVMNARERAEQLKGLRLSFPELKAWITIALSDADVGCMHGLGILGRPLTHEEKKLWLFELLEQVPDAARVLNARQILPKDWRQRFWDKR